MCDSAIRKSKRDPSAPSRAAQKPREKTKRGTPLRMTFVWVERRRIYALCGSGRSARGKSELQRAAFARNREQIAYQGNAHVEGHQ